MGFCFILEYDLTRYIRNTNFSIYRVASNYSIWRISALIHWSPNIQTSRRIQSQNYIYMNACMYTCMIIYTSVFIHIIFIPYSFP